MESRTKHTYRTHLCEFIKDVLVVCPNCNSQALVRTGDFSKLKYVVSGVKVVCPKCGFNKTLGKTSSKGKHLIFKAPVDPFFHLPLWLQSEIGDHLLWAYNMDHLEFLEQHIGAKLRERNGFKYQIRSIGAKLPRWMTAAKRREALLKAIEKLRTS